MTKKQCCTCKENKELSEFGKESKSKDGHKKRCKSCRKKECNDYYHKNGGKENAKKYRSNPEIRKNKIEYLKDWRSTSEIYKNNKPKYNDKWNNSEKGKEYNKEYHKEYKQTDKYKKKAREYEKRIKATPQGNIRERMKDGIRKSLKNGKEGRSWEELVGYTINDLMAHLEALFVDGMSWDNRSKWHIDHIIPQSFFNYEITEDLEFKACWALKNLQPLWKADNCSKCNSVIVQGNEDLFIEAIKSKLLKKYGKSTWNDFQGSLSENDCSVIAKDVHNICNSVEGIESNKFVMASVKIPEDNVLVHVWNYINEIEYDFSSGIVSKYIPDLSCYASYDCEVKSLNDDLI